MSTSGICFHSFIPMRKEPDERSEMISQILYGESFTILELNEKLHYTRIKLDHDGYTGWIDSKTYLPLKDTDREILHTGSLNVTHHPLTVLTSKNLSYSKILGCGSTIYHTGNVVIDLTKDEYIWTKKERNSITGDPRKALVRYGLKLVNIPYLWGGRSSFGFDCSGLCQNLYKQVGISLPRDSGPQSLTGKTISFLDEAVPGDLAFFDNKQGTIIHTGMLLDQNRILHASGRVRIDRIDQQGIFNKELNRYTHRLRVIRRILE